MVVFEFIEKSESFIYEALARNKQHGHIAEDMAPPASVGVWRRYFGACL